MLSHRVLELSTRLGTAALSGWGAGLLACAIMAAPARGEDQPPAQGHAYIPAAGNVPADVTDPESYIRAEIAGAPPIVAIDPAAANRSDLGRPPIADDSVNAGSNVNADSDGESDFDPTLVRNNPKAHAYAAQLRGPVITELRWAKLAAEFSDEQFLGVTQKAQDALFATAAEYALKHGKVNGGRYYPPPYNPATSVDVVRPLVMNVREAMVEAMTPEQKARYVKLLADRETFTREACIEQAICCFDAKLVLSDQQREAVGNALRESWDPDWETFNALRYSGALGSLPAIPLKAFRKGLDDEQIAAWRLVHKDDWRTTNLGMGGDVIPKDIPWDRERHQ